MHGRNKCSTSHYAMALLVLGCAYIALAPLSALASNQVNVNVNPTTGYYEYGQRTFRAPPEVRIGNAPVTPSVVRVPNGMTQSLPGTVEIVGQKASGLLSPPPQSLSGSMSSTVRAGAGAIKNGAARCLTSFRCNVAAMVASASLGTLLDSIDGLIEDSGRLNMPEEIPPLSGPLPPGSGGWSADNSFFRRDQGNFPSPESACRAYVSYLNSSYSYNSTVLVSGSGTSARYACRRGGTGGGWVQAGIIGYYGSSMICPSGYIEDNGFCSPDFQPDYYTPSFTEVESLLDNWDYQPDDWSWLTGGIDRSHSDFDIISVDLPDLSGAADPNFIERSDGTSQGTYSEVEFTVSGVPGKQPSVDVKSRDHTTEFDSLGNPQSSSTTTTNSSASVQPPPDIPTDCEFMPTVCRFIEWFTEPDLSPDPDQEIRDLVQVYEDGGRDVSVGSESGSCPPPRTIQLSLVPPVEFSFQPFCDLATAVRFWLLAIASFGAAYMTVRSI